MEAEKTPLYVLLAALIAVAVVDKKPQDIKKPEPTPKVVPAPFPHPEPNRPSPLPKP